MKAWQWKVNRNSVAELLLLLLHFVFLRSRKFDHWRIYSSRYQRRSIDRRLGYFFHKVTKTQRIFRENRIFENSYGSNGDQFAIVVRNTAWENSEIPSCSAMMLCRSVVHSLLPFITVLAFLFETANRQ